MEPPSKKPGGSTCQQEKNVNKHQIKIDITLKHTKFVGRFCLVIFLMISPRGNLTPLKAAIMCLAMMG